MLERRHGNDATRRPRHHLKQLLDAGIVQREKRGTCAYFSLSDGALEHVRGLLVQPALAG
jgi:DNA-binding transcriptional ArsR family regulator